MKIRRSIKKRIVSWWIEWDDLKWPDDDILKKIRIRADLMQKAQATTAIVFGAHFRWDFMPIWDCLHDYLRTVADHLHERGMELYDHHSAVLVHRFNNRAEMRNVKEHSGPHLPFSPSYEAAKSWAYRGNELNAWRMINVRTQKPVFLPQYTAEQFCHNNPDFIAAYCDYVSFLVNETAIDGLMCDDAVHFAGYTTCVCPRCLEQFRTEYGHEIPDCTDFSFWGNWKNKAWRDWIEFRYKSNGNFLSRVRSSLPQQFPLLSCCSGSIDGWKNHVGQDARQFARGCSIVHLEICGNTPPVNDPLTLNNSIAYKMAQGLHHFAVAKEKKQETIGQGYGFTAPSANIIWALNKMTASACWFSTLKGRLGLPSSLISHLPDDAEAAACAFTFESAHQELFNAAPVSSVGIYFSYNTRNNSLFGDLKNGYQKDYIDTMIAFFSHGIQIDILFSIPVNKEQYSAIVIPSALCLSDAEERQIEQYENTGGVIYATGPFGLLNGDGNPRTSYLAKYGIQCSFPDIRIANDFWDGNWQSTQTCSPCENSSGWQIFGKSSYWHSLRLQDNTSLDLVSVVRKRIPAPPVEGKSITGFLFALHKSKSDEQTLIVHLLAAEYDVCIDEALDRIRKHRSRVNLITEVRPKHTSRKISLQCDVKIENFEFFAPFHSNKPIKWKRNGTEISLVLPQHCSYIVGRCIREKSDILI